MTTPKHYRKYLFMYGIITIINVLEYFEFEENYEECYKIISAIKEQEERLKIELPTVITNDVIKDVVETYKEFGMTGKYAIENSKYYATLVIKEIESLKTA